MDFINRFWLIVSYNCLILPNSAAVRISHSARTHNVDPLHRLVTLLKLRTIALNFGIDFEHIALSHVNLRFTMYLSSFLYPQAQLCVTLLRLCTVAVDMGLTSSIFFPKST